LVIIKYKIMIKKHLTILIAFALAASTAFSKEEDQFIINDEPER
jgi:hypothetical protein